MGRADIQQRIGMLWLGRLEALLARHWPEATQYLELNSETLLQVLVEYGRTGGDGCRRQGGESAAKAGAASFLKSEKIERFLQVAASSVGVRQTAIDRRRMEECARSGVVGQA